MDSIGDLGTGNVVAKVFAVDGEAEPTPKRRVLGTGSHAPIGIGFKSELQSQPSIHSRSASNWPMTKAGTSLHGTG